MSKGGKANHSVTKLLVNIHLQNLLKIQLLVIIESAEINFILFYVKIKILLEQQN